MSKPGRRHKGKRTHAVVDEDVLKAIPRSFVLKNGKVTKSVKLLSRDLRQAYRPWTATNLKERRRATLKDYSDVGGVLNISHMVVLRQRADRVYASFLRTKGGEGPSCHFRVMSYTLIRDIFKSQSKPRSSESDYAQSPLIVTQGFDLSNRRGGKGGASGGAAAPLDAETLKEIKEKIFLQAFPSQTSGGANGTAQTLNGVRRVILFAYLGDKIFELRHYAIIKSDAFKDQFHSKPKIKRSPFKDEYKKEEAMPAEVKKEVLDEKDKIDFLRKNICLRELGPRLTMKLCEFHTNLASKLATPQEISDGANDDEENHTDDASSADHMEDGKEGDKHDGDDGSSSGSNENSDAGSSAE